MTSNRWRIIRDIEEKGAMQMAIDEAILTARIDRCVPNTLRFFTWKPSCLSVGYFQGLEKEVDVKRARDENVDIVRRYTGGGAVLHDKELTYSLAVSEEDVPLDIVKSYELICQAIIEGLSMLDVKAKFNPINDIIVGGKKISGNAQTRKSKVVLQHGTILLDVDVKKMFSLLKIPDEKIKDKMIKNVEERITSLKKEIGRDVNILVLREAIIAGFVKVFNVTFDESDLTEYEKELAEKLCAEKYSSKEWNYLR